MWRISMMMMMMFGWFWWLTAGSLFPTGHLVGYAQAFSHDPSRAVGGRANRRPRFDRTPTRFTTTITTRSGHSPTLTVAPIPATFLGSSSSLETNKKTWALSVSSSSRPPKSWGRNKGGLALMRSSWLPARSNSDYDDDNRDDEGEGEAPESAELDKDPVLWETSRVLQRISWFSWWAQVILTTVSSVMLIFARNVGQLMARGGSEGPWFTFALSGTGVLVSATSVLWTWGNSRLSRRLQRRPPGRGPAARMLRRAVRVGVTLNLVGLLLNLLAAEQIVGTLVVKVLTYRPFWGGAMGSGLPVMSSTAVEGLQPLDILVVQANTNMLLSHFLSLIGLLFLTDRIRTLDPPVSSLNNHRLPSMDERLFDNSDPRHPGPRRTTRRSI